MDNDFTSLAGSPTHNADKRRQPRSMATGRFGRKSGESQEFLSDLVAPHDSGTSIARSVLQRRAPNAWRVLEQVLR